MKIRRVLAPRPSGPFERCLATLAKKYPRARLDVEDELARLANAAVDVPAPPNVSAIPGVGRTVLKIRVASSDLQTGKRGGLRVILDHRGGEVWVPVLVYAKPERENVSRAEIVDAAQDEPATAPSG